MSDSDKTENNKELFDTVIEHLDWQAAWKEIGGTGVAHQRFGDDQRFGSVIVMFSCDGDAWVETLKDPNEFGSAQRFRETFAGGGQSRRVREAMMLLALAIIADNNERPQNRV